MVSLGANHVICNLPKLHGPQKRGSLHLLSICCPPLQRCAWTFETSTQAAVRLLRFRRSCLLRIDCVTLAATGCTNAQSNRLQQTKASYTMRQASAPSASDIIGGALLCRVSIPRHQRDGNHHPTGSLRFLGAGVLLNEDLLEAWHEDIRLRRHALLELGRQLSTLADLAALEDA